MTPSASSSRRHTVLVGVRLVLRVEVVTVPLARPHLVCDDSDPDTFPGAPEVCNGKDDACTGWTPTDEWDTDGDGFATCEGDCDEGDASVNPGAEEECDGRDSDCDGAVSDEEDDADRDGVTRCGGDCDDATSTVWPGAPERCNG